ncbi:hypothetical protein, conserved [Leishmania tarentolae]|uniref:Transmembrane protein n=1 Tax=Leishmania tarentolae TaxID=5689 RepID=A0A640K9Z3_LEITA|nr:hypothetical protein, conserved [Leishmania tarentolae]
MTQKTVAAAFLTAVALLVLLTALFPSVAAAAVIPTHVSSLPTAVQRQRLRSFAAYAERVGMALELFTRGHVENDTDTGGTASDFAKDRRMHPFAGLESAPSVQRMSLPGLVTECLQHLHIVVQSSVQSVVRLTSAGHTLASVLVGASLGKDAEALLTKAAADAHFHAEVGNIMAPPPVSLSNADRIPASTRRTTRAVSTPRANYTPLDRVFGNASRQRADEPGDQPTAATPLSCIGGVNAYSSNTIVACRNSRDIYTAAEYVSLPFQDQEQCNGYVSEEGPFTQTCVCAHDCYMIYITASTYVCRSRPLDLQVLLEDRHLCFSKADAALGLAGTMEGEYCIKTRRNSTLQLRVTWKYSFLSDDAMLGAWAFGSKHVPPEVPQESEGLQWVVLSGERPVMGTYSELSVNSDVFDYLVAGYAGLGQPSPSPKDVGFYLSANTELLSAAAFSAVFCFTSPYKTKDQLKEVPLEEESALKRYLGNVDGVTSHSLTLHLSAVPDDFIEGNQMYVEVGLKGGPSIYHYRVARIHISFTDLAEPPTNAHKYTKPLDPLYILLIATVSVLVVGTALAMLWYSCMESHDFDDRLLSDAQRKSAQKHHPIAQ